jgi:TRAP-type uncharacterized transport system fused permease subunit
MLGATAAALAGIVLVAIAAGGWMAGPIHPAGRLALGVGGAVLLWGGTIWRLLAVTSAILVLILQFTRHSPRGEPVGGR